MARNVKNGDKVCLGYSVIDLRKYQGTDGPGDRSALTPEALAGIRNFINDENTRAWVGKLLFVTACGGALIKRHNAGEPPPKVITCLSCLGEDGAEES